MSTSHARYDVPFHISIISFEWHHGHGAAGCIILLQLEVMQEARISHMLTSKNIKNTCIGSVSKNRYSK